MLGLVAFCATAIFAVNPLMDAISSQDTLAVLVYSCFGIICASPAHLAVLATLWSVPFWWRMFVSIGIGLLFISAWICGYWVVYTDHGYGLWDVILFSLRREYGLRPLCVPLVFFAIQFPLWIARTAFRWDLTTQDPDETHTFHPLTIRDILVGMTLVGLGMTAARFSMSYSGNNGSPEDFWMVVGIVMASVSGVSLISTLPVLVASFRIQRLWLAILVIGAYTVVVSLITFAVIAFFQQGFVDGEMIYGLSIMFAAYAATLVIPLSLAHYCGVRLTWGRETMTDSLPPASPWSEDEAL